MTAPVFVIRDPATGAVRLNKDMFAMSLIEKGVVANIANPTNVTVQHPDCVIATACSNGHATVINWSSDATSTTFTLDADGGDVTWYAFGKPPDVAGVLGLKVRNPATGEVVLDTRYPPMRVLSRNNTYNSSYFGTGTDTTLNPMFPKTFTMPVGTSIASIMAQPAWAFWAATSPPQSPGVTAYIMTAGVKTIGNQAEVLGYVFATTPGVVGAKQNYIYPGLFTFIDVSGY